jgi:hypothetical protein
MERRTKAETDSFEAEDKTLDGFAVAVVETFTG